MIRIDFTEEAIEKLRYERFHHPHPRVQRKMEALLLKSDGLPHHRITRILGISENTFRQYLREYEEGGVERLKELHFYRPLSELAEHHKSLERREEEKDGHYPCGSIWIMLDNACPSPLPLPRKLRATPTRSPCTSCTTTSPGFTRHFDPRQRCGPA